MSLLDAARDHVRQLLGVVQTRLELVELELADARDHLVAVLVYAGIAVFFGGITIVAALTWLIMAYWDDRLAIIGGATLLFALFAAIAAWRALSHAQSGGDIFSDSLLALQTDRAALRPPPVTQAPAPQAAGNDNSNYVGD